MFEGELEGKVSMTQEVSTSSDLKVVGKSQKSRGRQSEEEEEGRDGDPLNEVLIIWRLAGDAAKGRRG